MSRRTVLSSRTAAVAATTTLLALLAGAAPAQAAPARAATSCATTLQAGALLTTTVVPRSNADLVGTSTRATRVRVDAHATDAAGDRVYHLRPGTVLTVQVAQGLQQVTRTELLSGAWVRAADVRAPRALQRCAARLG